MSVIRLEFNHMEMAGLLNIKARENKKVFQTTGSIPYMISSDSFSDSYRDRSKHHLSIGIDMQGRNPYRTEDQVCDHLTSNAMSHVEEILVLY